MRDLVRCAALVLAVVTLGASPVTIVGPEPRSGTWRAAGIAKLDADLDAMLRNDPALHGAHYGVYAIDTASGTPLYERHVDDEIQPASTFKLVVGSAAIDRLGPAYTFVTGMFAAPDKRELVLRAGGDPFLSSIDLQAAAKAVAPDAAFGAYVVIDDRRFDEEPYPRGWTWDDFGQSYAPRISALAVDEDLLGLRVTPGASLGSSPNVATAVPRALTISQVVSSALADSSDCTTSWNFNDVKMLSTAVTGASGSDDTLDVRLTANGCSEVVGSIPLGAAADAVDLAIPDVRGYAAGVVSGFINRVPAARIVSPVDRFEPVPRIADATIPVWSHVSAPLSQWLGSRFWIPSDNLVGEMLLRELGYVTAGAPGTTDSGIAYEKSWLQSIGVDPSTVTLADGCGMSQYDRITPRDLVTILQHDWNGPSRQLVVDSLPVGGARGTIEGIAGTDAAGRVFAKTGSMMHVRGLAGYLATRNHGAVTFAFEVDDWNGSYPALAALRARVLSRIVDD